MAPTFSLAVAFDERDVNPANEFHFFFKPGKQGQQTALAAEEIPRSLRAFETCNSAAASGLWLLARSGFDRVGALGGGMAAVRGDQVIRSGDPAGQHTGAVGRAIVTVLGGGDEGSSAGVAKVDLGRRGGVLRVKQQSVRAGADQQDHRKQRV